MNLIFVNLEGTTLISPLSGPFYRGLRICKNMGVGGTQIVLSPKSFINSCTLTNSIKVKIKSCTRKVYGDQ